MYVMYVAVPSVCVSVSLLLDVAASSNSLLIRSFTAYWSLVMWLMLIFAGHDTWNSLPLHLHCITDTAHFKCKLKTELSRPAFDQWLLFVFFKNILKSFVIILVLLVDFVEWHYINCICIVLYCIGGGRWLGQPTVQRCMITSCGSLLATMATFVWATCGPHRCPVTRALYMSGKRSTICFSYAASSCCRCCCCTVHLRAMCLQPFSGNIIRLVVWVFSVILWCS